MDRASIRPVTDRRRQSGEKKAQRPGLRVCVCKYLFSMRGVDAVLLRTPLRARPSLAPPHACSSVLSSMVLYVARGPDAIETLNARNLSYSEVACVAVLTWDVLVTLTEEVRSVTA